MASRRLCNCKATANAKAVVLLHRLSDGPLIPCKPTLACFIGIVELGERHVRASKRVLLTFAIAGLLAAAPAFVPLPQQRPVQVAGAACGAVAAFRTIDSANADPVIIPCPVQPTTTPWTAIIMGASVVSVMINAAIVHQTQCRELTFQEAYASMSLPFVGWLFNQQHNQCGRRGHHH